MGGGGIRLAGRLDRAARYASARSDHPSPPRRLSETAHSAAAGLRQQRYTRLYCCDGLRLSVRRDSLAPNVPADAATLTAAPGHVQWPRCISARHRCDGRGWRSPSQSRRSSRLRHSARCPLCHQPARSGPKVRRATAASCQAGAAAACGAEPAGRREAEGPTNSRAQGQVCHLQPLTARSVRLDSTIQIRGAPCNRAHPLQQLRCEESL